MLKVIYFILWTRLTFYVRYIIEIIWIWLFQFDFNTKMVLSFLNGRMWIFSNGYFITSLCTKREDMILFMVTWLLHYLLEEEKLFLRLYHCHKVIIRLALENDLEVYGKIRDSWHKWTNWWKVDTIFIMYCSISIFFFCFTCLCNPHLVFGYKQYEVHSNFGENDF